MAKLREGILGGLSGAVGTVVGGRWRDVDYIRSKPAIVRNPNTEAQQAQRKRFALMIRLMKRIRLYINEGFALETERRTPMNNAMSVNLKNAIQGTFPDFEISFPDLMVARGDLKKPAGAGVEVTPPDTVTFSWTDNSGRASAKASDIALALIINYDSDDLEYDIENHTRADASLTLQVPPEWYGDTLECYLAFKSEDGAEVSNSVYLGSVVVEDPEGSG